MIIDNPNLLNDFKEFIDSYISRLDLVINKTPGKIDRDERKKQVLEYSFGLKGKYYTTEELAFLLNQSAERIRQVKNQIIADLHKDIFGSKETLFQNTLFQNLKDFKIQAENLGVISQSNFLTIINKHFNTDVSISPYLKLLVDIFGFKTQKIYLHLLKDNDLIFFNKEINPKQFIDICYSVYIIIERHVISIDIDDIIISVRRQFQKQNLSNSLIQMAIESIDSCEYILKDGKKTYRINFHKLSSYADMAYRILFEKKEPLKLIEIQREINSHLKFSKRTITSKQNFGAQLNGDKRFIPLGKTGVWTLTEWGENNQSIYELITNTLLHFDKPLSRKEISNHIKKTRPFIQDRSLLTYLYDSRYSVLDNRTYILSDWKELYKSKIVKTELRGKETRTKENKVPEQIKNQAINMFEENDTNELLLSTIVNVLSKKFKFPKASIYRVISEDKIFETIEIDSYRKKVNLKSEMKKQQKPQLKTTSVFVSYSWESPQYKEKVISFVNFLRENGFNADMDIKLMQQESSIDFNRLMHKGITGYNKVIILLSESYKQKAENFEGGVGKEYRYVSSDIQKEPKKYILASFSSLSTDIIDKITPIDFSQREIVDLVSDEKTKFENLFSKLTNSERYLFSEVASQTPIVENIKIEKFTLK